MSNLEVLNLKKEGIFFTNFDALVHFRLVKFYEKRFECQLLIKVSRLQVTVSTQFTLFELILSQTSQLF